MDGLNWNLNLTMADPTDDPDDEPSNEPVEPGPDDWAMNATLTTPDGKTQTVRDFTVNDISVERSEAATNIRECTAGLSPRIEDVEQTFQLSIEVPTKTLECPNCGYKNHVPIWNFVQVEFNGDLEGLSGEYAVGHNCVYCRYPH